MSGIGQTSWSENFVVQNAQVFSRDTFSVDPQNEVLRRLRCSALRLERQNKRTKLIE